MYTPFQLSVKSYVALFCANHWLYRLLAAGLRVAYSVNIERDLGYDAITTEDWISLAHNQFSI